MPERLGPPRATPLFERLAIVGLGLIGSSIARAARHLNLARHDRRHRCRARRCVARVRELGIADEATTDAAAACADADLVILCVPVGASAAVAEAIARRG